MANREPAACGFTITNVWQQTSLQIRWRAKKHLIDAIQSEIRDQFWEQIVPSLRNQLAPLMRNY